MPTPSEIQAAIDRYGPGVQYINGQWVAASNTNKSGGSKSGSKGGTVGTDDADIRNAIDVADKIAEREYFNKKLELVDVPGVELEKEKFAFQKAQEAWMNAYREAALTGTYGGKPTVEWLAQEAQMTGIYNGQPTMAREQMLAQLTGEYGGAPTWDKVRQKAELTGMIDGDPTLQRQQMELAATGYFGGVPTMAREAMELAATGYYGGSPTFERERWLSGETGYVNGDPTLNRQRFETEMSGYMPGGQATLAREAEQNRTGMSALQIIANLRGARNAFQQARAMRGAQSLGLTDLINAAAGTLNLGMGGTNAPPEVASLAGLIADSNDPSGMLAQSGLYSAPARAYAQSTNMAPAGNVVANTTPALGNPVQGGPAQVTPGQYEAEFEDWRQKNLTPSPPVDPEFGGRVNVAMTAAGPALQTNPPGAQAPVNAYNYQPTGDGSSYTYPPGVQAPRQAAQVSSNTPVTSPALNQAGTNALATQPYGVPAYNAPTTQRPGGYVPPNQLNAKQVNKMTPYEQELLWGYYEDKGWDVDAAQQTFKQSLPKATGPRAGRLVV